MAEWRIVFWVTFAVFVITTIVYVIWASGEVQPWNEPEDLDQFEDGGAIPESNGKIVESTPSFTVLGVSTESIVTNGSKALEAAKSEHSKEPLDDTIRL